jgi:Flp pilus assembly protein TadG
VHQRTDSRSERGQAMVEFALVLPVLMFILLAIIQFGIAYNDYVTLTDAVRTGARQAAVDRQLPDPVADATARVRSAAADLDQSQLTVTVTSDWQAGHPVQVYGAYPYSISIMGIVVKSGALTSTTIERVE